MITLAHYWMGRDVRYADALTPRIRDNAMLTVERINALLSHYELATGDDHQRSVNSGWRPPAINAGVRRAAANSKHLTGEACDLSDDDESLDLWLEHPDGLSALAEVGLWIEASAYTVRWTHLQTRPPASGRRVFIP
jgi:hypothetical protein